MDAQQLRELQAPLKSRYRQDPAAARVRLHATGQIDAQALVCTVPTLAGDVRAGLHPAAGGSGREACSAEMLLQSLAACSGVTMAAVATAMGIELQRAEVRVEGEMDFRGTLGIERQVPVGLTDVWLEFDLDSPADDAALERLVELTERYCVVLQTLLQGTSVRCRWSRSR
ncbi:MAG: OsmC family peroxiredoxin [Planctomycetota bacterium]|nr:MAG: OsmC family peroxiredoxin [Planctomycetota bacterium]